MPKATSMTLRIGHTELPGTPDARQFVVAYHGGVPVSFPLGALAARRQREGTRSPLPGGVHLRRRPGNFELDETEITARPGELVIAPAGAPHRFANTGAGELRPTAIHPAAEMTTDSLSSPLAEQRGDPK